MLLSYSVIQMDVQPSFYLPDELPIREQEKSARWTGAGSLWLSHCSPHNYFITTWHLLHTDGSIYWVQITIRDTKMIKIRSWDFI